MSYIALLGKEGPPPPLSTVEAILGVSLVLVGIALAVLIAGVRSGSGRRSGRPFVCASVRECPPSGVVQVEVVRVLADRRLLSTSASGPPPEPRRPGACACYRRFLGRTTKEVRP